MEKTEIKDTRKVLDVSNSMLNDSGVAISDCNLDGMTINGILVEELLKAYNNK